MLSFAWLSSFQLHSQTLEDELLSPPTALLLYKAPGRRGICVATAYAVKTPDRIFFISLPY